MQEIKHFIKTHPHMWWGLYLPVVSVVGEREVLLAVCGIELERVSAVDTVEGYGALLGETIFPKYKTLR